MASQARKVFGTFEKRHEGKLCSYEKYVQRTALGPVSRKPRKLFGPAKPFLIACILKTKKRVGIKLCMKDNFIHVKICEKNSSVNLRLEIFVMAFRVRKLFGTFEKRAPVRLILAIRSLNRY